MLAALGEKLEPSKALPQGRTAEKGVTAEFGRL